MVTVHTYDYIWGTQIPTFLSLHGLCFSPSVKCHKLLSPFSLWSSLALLAEINRYSS